jgi:hypothetical protein
MKKAAYLVIAGVLVMGTSGFAQNNDLSNNQNAGAASNNTNDGRGNVGIGTMNTGPRVNANTTGMPDQDGNFISTSSTGTSSNHTTNVNSHNADSQNGNSGNINQGSNY